MMFNVNISVDRFIIADDQQKIIYILLHYRDYSDVHVILDTRRGWINIPPAGSCFRSDSS